MDKRFAFYHLNSSLYTHLGLTVFAQLFSFICFFVIFKMMDVTAISMTSSKPKQNHYVTILKS